MESIFRPGDIVQHFKRELLTEEERAGNMYLYEIVGVALHSETREEMMVYQKIGEKAPILCRESAEKVLFSRVFSNNAFSNS